MGLNVKVYTNSAASEGAVLLFPLKYWSFPFPGAVPSTPRAKNAAFWNTQPTLRGVGALLFFVSPVAPRDENELLQFPSQNENLQSEQLQTNAGCGNSH